MVVYPSFLYNYTDIMMGWPHETRMSLPVARHTSMSNKHVLIHCKEKGASNNNVKTTQLAPSPSHVPSWARRSPIPHIGVPVDSATIFCDNQSAIHLASNPAHHERSKHVDIDYHLIRELVQSHVLKLINHVRTKLTPSGGFVH